MDATEITFHVRPGPEFDQLEWTPPESPDADPYFEAIAELCSVLDLEVWAGSAHTVPSPLASEIRAVMAYLSEGLPRGDAIGRLRAIAEKAEALSSADPDPAEPF